MFALETIAAQAFVGLMLYAWPIVDPDAVIGAAAGLLSAAAMGVQSTLVRLLLRGVPQTNVMTGNSTQFAIDATELVYAKFRPAQRRRRCRARGTSGEARKRFATVFMVLSGFLVGAMGGALAFRFRRTMERVPCHCRRCRIDRVVGDPWRHRPDMRSL